jgi:predicted Fe-Mo cluster-binding NifX family protein
MKLCIPTETSKGKTAKVYGHFGSSPYFTIYDMEKDTFEVIDNSNQHHDHGTCHPVGALKDKDINAVVCTGMGLRAVQKLNDSGIKTYKANANTVAAVIKKYKNNEAEEINTKNACHQHNCH